MRIPTALLLTAWLGAGCGAGAPEYVRPGMPAPEPSSIRAAPDRRLSARVVRRRPLTYSAGADVSTGRPAHVRAGSALTWVGTRLAVVQDDALFLALVVPGSAEVTALAFPVGVGGARLFDEERGNKADKLDLESALVFESRLFAFGSGSTSQREQVVAVTDLDTRPRAATVPAHRLFAMLRRNTEFSGSELNVEGVALLGDRVLLFQRGNGRASAEAPAVDAVGELDARALVAYLDSRDTSEPPVLQAVRRYELGSVQGVRLTFTDATTRGGHVAYLAAAESSPDVVRDGPVVGTAIGVIDRDGSARQTEILDEQGRPFADKAEGLALDPSDRGRAFVVIDRDDPHVPTELCELALTGFP